MNSKQIVYATFANHAKKADSTPSLVYKQLEICRVVIFFGNLWQWALKSWHWASVVFNSLQKRFPIVLGHYRDAPIIFRFQIFI